MKRSTIAAVLCGFALVPMVSSIGAPSAGAKSATKPGAKATAAHSAASAKKPACCELHENKTSPGVTPMVSTVAAKAAPGKPPTKSAQSKSSSSKPSNSTKATPKKKTAAQLREERIVSLWKQSDKAFHAGNYPLAVSFHRQIVAIDPADVEAYSNAAWLLWSMGKGDDALAFLQRGIKANPKNADMWEALGNHYGSFLKRHREAQVAYTRAIQYSPSGANTQMLRRRLAHAAEGAGDLQTSLSTWRALVRDYPGIPVNRNNLARVEKLMKRGSVST